MATILIDGAGTVGSRVARAALSLGHSLVLTKYQANEDDVKTEELRELRRDFNGDIKVYVLSPAEPSYGERVKSFNKLGIEVSGSSEDIDYSSLTHVINCAPDKKGCEAKDDERYKNHMSIPVLWQAKAPGELYRGEEGAGLFLSVPCSLARTDPDFYKGKRAANGSCNDTFLGTATGVVLEAFEKLDRPADIAAIDANLSRRYGDRKIDLNKKPRYGPKHEGLAKADSDYIAHFDEMFPELRRRLSVTRSLNPWESFHYGIVRFRTTHDLGGSDIEAVKQHFKTYERCVFVDGGKFSAGRVVSACNYLGIPHEGDFAMPLYTIEADLVRRPNELVVSGLNCQRSVVVPSNMDWIRIVDGTDVDKTVRTTNEMMRWHGYTLPELKHVLEEELKRNIK